MGRLGFLATTALRRWVILLGLASLAVHAGCTSSETPSAASPATPRFPGTKVNVGVLGDPAILTGLSAQRGEWVASRGGEIQIKEDAIASADQLGGVDVVIFPGQELGNLVDQNALEVIANRSVMPPKPVRDEAGAGRDPSPSEPPPDLFQYQGIAPAYRDQVTKYGSDRLALPLGGTALVLAYRRDAFDRPENLQAAAAAGIKLEAPTTWSQLDALAKFFHGRDWNGDGTPDQGIAAVLGHDPEGLGNALFLARAASLGQHRDQFSFLFDADSMAPRIAAPPFVEALQGLLTWKDLGPSGGDSFYVTSAREAFRSGKVALLIDRAEQAAAWSESHPVGVFALPGSDRVYEPLRKQWETPSSLNAPSYLPLGGGWLVGVKRGLGDTQAAAALDLAIYLAAPDNVNRLRAERAFPMLPVRSAQMGKGLPDPISTPDVDSKQWADALSQTLMAERVVPGLRIPAAGQYLDLLSKGRVAALAGTDPEAALKDVAAGWTALTESLGKDRQLWHYRRSLNTLATLPDPPPRKK